MIPFSSDDFSDDTVIELGLVSSVRLCAICIFFCMSNFMYNLFSFSESNGVLFVLQHCRMTSGLSLRCHRPKKTDRWQTYCSLYCSGVVQPMICCFGQFRGIVCGFSLEAYLDRLGRAETKAMVCFVCCSTLGVRQASEIQKTRDDWKESDSMLLVLQHCGSVTKLKHAQQKEKESIKAIRPPEIDNVVACKLFSTLRMYFLVDSATCKKKFYRMSMQLPEFDTAVASEHQLPSGVSCAESLLDTHTIVLCIASVCL